MPTSTRTRSSWVDQHGDHARAPGATARTASSAVFRSRRPTATPLYPVVQHHLETFLAEAQEANPMGWGVPAWVERDFRGYLRCGILAHGLASPIRRETLLIFEQASARTDSRGCDARTAGTTGSWPSPAKVAGCARHATPDAWPRWRST